MVRVTYKLQESNGRKFDITGSGGTRTAAVAEANAKLALTCGTVLGGSVSDLLTVGETGTANGDASYSDAELTLKRTATGEMRTLHLENISNAYGDATTGAIDITEQDIIDFATAYVDAGGFSGYVPFSGKYVK